MRFILVLGDQLTNLLIVDRQFFVRSCSSLFWSTGTATLESWPTCFAMHVAAAFQWLPVESIMKDLPSHVAQV